MEGTICDEDNLDSLFLDEWNDTESSNRNVARDSTWNISNNSIFNNTKNTSTARLDVSALCCDEELTGFDKNAGPSWIYPTNYPVRDYQFNIISHALFKNTLVSLPTGLGKTFIAAVLMYNFYRWYPLGKIVFTAPTRPLVAQQIDACYNITAIPPQDTIEMTGTMQANTRKIAWKQKRVFFATPQVVYNDIKSGICPGELIRCLVIDEAHRAKGKHAYCQLVEALTERGFTLLRMLALSATPGSKVEDVITVVKNLHIAHLELRSENCIDVAMYSHSRKMETIVVPLGDELTNIRKQYVEIMDKYTRRLVQYRILSGNISNFSKGKIMMLYKEFQGREKTQRHPQHQWIMQDFTMVITLYHALELLTKHGARVFLNFFDERTDKQWVGKDDNLTCFLERLRDDLGLNPFTINRSILPDGSIPEITEDLKFGHPKFDHLKEVIVEHFKLAESKGLKNTKAIVFCEYRESVNLVHCLLLQCRPVIRPHVFIGQGSGGGNKDLKSFSQKQQLKVMKMFRENVCNVLVSTCIGEEGLDVGSVDLIICFDISNKSPIRLVQRCGRTGREREGRVVILVTEGREHQTLRECILQRDSLNKRVLQSKELVRNLYSASPRMLPKNLQPICQKMFITVQKTTQEVKSDKTNKVQSKLVDMFKKRTSSKDIQCNGVVSKENLTELFPNGIPTSSRFESNVEHWNKPAEFFKIDDSDGGSTGKKLNLSEWLEWQRTLQYTINVDHSVDSEILCHLLKTADSKRFCPSESHTQPQYGDLPIPITQSIPKPKTPIKSGNKNTVKSKMKSNNDIRTMFQKLHKPSEEEIKKNKFDRKVKEIFMECGYHNEDMDKTYKILEDDGITPQMIEIMVQINTELTKVTKNDMDTSQFETHKCLKEFYRTKQLPTWLNQPLEMPNYENIIRSMEAIDLADFERILKLDDKNCGDTLKTNEFSTEIDFCDDSLFKVDDMELTMDNNEAMYKINVNKDLDDNEPIMKINSNNESTIKINSNKEFDNNESTIKINVNNESKINVNKDLDNTASDVDCDIKKFMMNDDFEIGDVDDIFEDTDDCFDDVKTHNVHNNICDNVKDYDDKINIKDNDINSCFNDAEENTNYEDSKVVKSAMFPNDFEIGDVDDIFENTDDDLMNDDKVVDKSSDRIKEDGKDNAAAVKSLSFFGLDNVEDLFENDDGFEEENNPEINSLIENDSPFDPPDSPILFSQKSFSNSRKLSMTNHSTSTPLGLNNNLKKSVISKENTPNNNNISIFNKDASLLSGIIFSNSKQKPKKDSHIRDECPNTTNLKSVTATSFSITQIIDLVNAENNETIKSNQKETKGFSKNPETNSSDESTHSLILCSQVTKPTKKKTNASLKQSINITILESSESSGDDMEIIDNVEDLHHESTNFKSKVSTAGSRGTNVKRRLISSEEEFEVSPFFNQPAVPSPPLKLRKISLKGKIEKTMESLAKNKTTSSSSTTTSNSLELFKNTKNVRSQLLSQFSRQKPSQWNSDCSKVNILKSQIDENSSDDDSNFVNKTPKKTRKIFRKKEKRKGHCEFIDYEAALSDDSYEDSGDELSQEGGDANVSKFICDEDVEDHHKGVDMQAKYLQSVRSPVKSHGQFKIPIMKPKTSDISIFSQADPDEHQNYVLDSFCVDDHILSQRHEVCELELAEAILKKRKRRKKQKQTSPPPRAALPTNTNPADDSPIARNKKPKKPVFLQSESGTEDELFL